MYKMYSLLTIPEHFEYSDLKLTFSKNGKHGKSLLCQASFGTTLQLFFTQLSSYYSGGSKGAQGTRPPPRGCKFFQFHAFFGKFGKIVCWRPPGELAPPPRGNPGSATVLWS